MPALLTSTSLRPYFAIVSATPFSTAASSATFIPTAKASDPFALISRAVAPAWSKLRSAMTGTPPSAANRSAISLPMPLAAPVMIATLSEKQDTSRFLSRVFHVIEHHFAETERQVGDVVGGRDHLAHRQPRGVQSTCGMILIMKFGRANAFNNGAGSISRCLKPIVAETQRTEP